MILRPATKPTMYFIGVSTGQSLIMRVFPAWAKLLELGDCALAGIDLPLNARHASYREVVDFIASDPLSLGALVTTHKLDLFEACHERFARIDEFAAMMRETSALSKDGGRLVCAAKDAVSSQLAMNAFVPAGHWTRRAADVFVIGAGGAATAITWALRQRTAGDRPARVVVSDVASDRLDALGRVHERAGGAPHVELVHVRHPEQNDAIVASLAEGSLVVNATGLGKDRPGSPLTDGAPFPRGGIAWELNYRGELRFLHQASAQQDDRELRVEDGWLYFVHGWTQVIADVFHREIPTAGPGFDELLRAAADSAARTPA